MALTIFEILVVGAIAFLVGFMIALHRDRAYPAGVIEKATSDDSELEVLLRPAEQQDIGYCRKVAVLVLPASLLLTGTLTPGGMTRLTQCGLNTPAQVIQFQHPSMHQEGSLPRLIAGYPVIPGEWR
jgi:hypothetical protein